MPSDSPVIITDGSLEIYSARGDFDNPPASAKTYHIKKKNAAKAIKFFGRKIDLAPSDTWSITVNGAAGPVATIRVHDASDLTVVVAADTDLDFKDDHMAGAINPDRVVSISVTKNGQDQGTFHSDCHIRFR